MSRPLICFVIFAFVFCLTVPGHRAHSLVPIEHAQNNSTNNTGHSHGNISLALDKASSLVSKNVSKRQAGDIVKVSNSKELQTALEKAGPGTKIHLEPGLYHGPFVAEGNGHPENPVQISGENREDTVITGTKQGTAFTVSGDFYQISNLFIKDSKVGVKLQGMETYLKNLLIDQTEVAVRVEGKGGHVLEGSIIHCSKEPISGESELLIQQNNVVQPCFENIH